MIEIAICDDEKRVASEIEDILLEIMDMKNIDINISIFYDGTTLLDYINQGHRFDIIYMDIEMKYKDGVATAIELRKIDTTVLLIYVTNHESFAKDVFEVDAFRFITKPVNVERFKRYFDDALDRITVYPVYFQYKFNRETYRIPFDHIMYFESDKRITYIFTKDQESCCYEKLNVIEKLLLDNNINFYRIHKSFLVNPKYVKRYNFDSMELMDGTILMISEKRRKEVSQLVCNLKGEDIIAY